MCYKYVNILSDKQNVIIISLIPLYVTFFPFILQHKLDRVVPLIADPPLLKLKQ